MHVMQRVVRALRRDDDGGVLVQVAITLPLMILLASFVIDMGNWFVHKRHLQMQADAAAFAAARDFTYPCSSDTIIARAVSYGGGEHNAQIGLTPGPLKEGADIGPAGERGVHMLVNSEYWPLQDGETRDETVTTGAPCEARMIDVKLTETAVPWFFRVADVDFINAHARVEIRKMATTKGPLPIAAVDTDPKLARVQWVDESTGEVLGQSDLVKTGVADGLAQWTNAAGTPGSPGPAAVDVSAKNIGVRVALSAGSSTECGQPLVECYDLDDDAEEPMHIRGWSGDATGVHARDVRLLASTCPDPYFVDVDTACDVGVWADIQGFPADTRWADVEVRAFIEDGPNNGALMTRNADGTWQLASGLPVDPAAGGLPVSIAWKYKNGKCPAGTTACDGDFGVVQRVWSASAGRSGPIKRMQVWARDGDDPAAEPQFWQNSFQRCSAAFTDCERDLTITLGLEPTFQDARGPDDPIRDLRIQVDNGAQTQTLDCDPDLQFEQELAQGCDETYEKNTGTACPSATDQKDLPQPWDCVGVVPGNRLPQILDGLNLRVFGDANAGSDDCDKAPNRWEEHWTLDPATGEYTLDPAIAEDPRLIQVFVAPFGTFDGSGADETVPITNFAYFYATGWSGQGGTEGPCAGLGDDPVPDSGWIVGHFVDYIPTLRPGQAGEEMCELSDLSSCISIMTI